MCLIAVAWSNSPHQLLFAAGEIVPAFANRVVEVFEDVDIPVFFRHDTVGNGGSRNQIIILEQMDSFERGVNVRIIVLVKHIKSGTQCSRQNSRILRDDSNTGAEIGQANLGNICDQPESPETTSRLAHTQTIDSYASAGGFHKAEEAQC